MYSFELQRNKLLLLEVYKINQLRDEPIGRLLWSTLFLFQCMIKQSRKGQKNELTKRINVSHQQQRPSDEENGQRR